MSARAVALALATAAVLHAGWTAWVSSWTVDEPAHLRWSARLLDEGTTARPGPFDNSKTPLMVAHVLASRAADALGARSPRSHRFAARLPAIAMLALLFLATHRIARGLAGERAAAIAVGGAALDPNLVAHGSLATADLPFALATLVGVAAAFAFHRDPTPRRAALLGAAIAFAFTAKFTALLVVPLLVVVPPICGVRAPRAAVVRGLALALAVAAALIALTYRVVGVGDFAGGIARCIREERTLAWNGYLLGARVPDGAASYFLVHWIVKTPLPLLVLTVVGLARARLVRPEAWGLAIVAFALAFYFSFVFRTQVGYRYVLAVLPILYILAAAGLADRGPILVAAAALALVELAPYRGNPLAFTNTLIVDKRLGYRVTADSNLYWGQTSERAGAWFARQPEPRRHDPERIGRGLNLIDVNWLVAVWPPDRFACIRTHFVPDRQVAFTHVVYDVDDARLAAMRARCPREVE